MPDVIAAGGLLAVHAHPDDETLSTGALLATWAAAGRPVTVVTCTRGEQGEVIPAELAHLEGDGPALAAHRETELAAALDALGVTDHVFLDRVHAHDDGDPGSGRYVDSGMAWVRAGQATAAERIPAGAFVTVDLDEAASRLATVLRDRRPDVVVGYEPGGGYGHPDHVRAHEVMHRALALAADPELRPPAVDPDARPPAADPDARPPAADPDARRDRTGPWRVPVVLWSVLDEAAVRSARRALGLPDPDRPLPSAAVARASIDLEVDALRVRDQVVAALRAHRSQVQGVQALPEARTPGAQDAGDRDPAVVGADQGDRGPAVVGGAMGRYALSDGVLTPLIATECYSFATGPDGASDATTSVPTTTEQAKPEQAKPEQTTRVPTTPVPTTPVPTTPVPTTPSARAVAWPSGIVLVASEPPAPTVT